jgi:hypothetical protein
MINNAAVKNFDYTRNSLHITNKFEGTLIAKKQDRKPTIGVPIKENEAQNTEKVKSIVLEETKNVWKSYQTKYPEVFDNDWFLSRSIPEVEFKNKLEGGEIAHVKISEPHKIYFSTGEANYLYKKSGSLGLKQTVAHEIVHILTMKMIKHLDFDRFGHWETYNGARHHINTEFYLHSKNSYSNFTLRKILTEGAAEFLSSKTIILFDDSDLYKPILDFTNRLIPIVGIETYKKFALLNDKKSYETVVKAAFKLAQSEQALTVQKICDKNRVPNRNQKTARLQAYSKTTPIKLNSKPFNDNQLKLLREKYKAENDLKFLINSLYPCENQKYDFSFLTSINSELKKDSLTDAEIDKGIRKLHSRMNKPIKLQEKSNIQNAQDAILRFFGQ